MSLLPTGPQMRACARRAVPRGLVAITTAGVLTVPTSAQAQFGLGALDTWTSGEAGLLAAILGEEVAQAGSLVESVTRLTQVVTALNDLLASGREAVRIAKAVESLDPDRILREVETAFLTSFPEARSLKDELEDLSSNVDALEARDGSFKALITQGDFRVDDLARRTLSYGFRSSAYALIEGFPPPEPTRLDLRLESHFLKAGEGLKRSFRSSAWRYFQRELQHLRRQAHTTENLAAMVAGNNAAANLQAAQSTEGLLELERLKTAQAVENIDAFEAWRAETQTFLQTPSGLGAVLAPPEVK